MTAPTGGRVKQFREIMACAKISSVILLVALIYNPGKTQGQTLPSSYHVSLAWDAHIDPTVTGYRVHYGTASGNYTSSIAVGSLRTVKIQGLLKDIVYFFALTALNSSGLESAFSNQVSFLPGLDGISIQRAANGSIDLNLKGLINQKYEIEATQDLKTWTLINTVTVGDGGSLKLNDSNAAIFPSRFYRARKSP
jgi:hypothetical protein